MKEDKLGFLFEGQLWGSRKAKQVSLIEGRLLVLWVIVAVVIGIFVLRLGWLQIVRGEYHRTLSEENRILARRIQAPRGVIYDRRGNILAQNIPVYKVRNEECQTKTCPEFVEISRDKALELEAESGSSEVLTFVGREYPYGIALAHVVGYVGEISEEELTKKVDYELGDLIGKIGIEKSFDDLLHGRNGAELVETDASMQVIREVARKEPVSGEDLRLTVDAGLQVKATESFEGRKGSLVALDPNNGEVLALISSPAFDPNQVSDSLGNPQQPFFNRAFSGTYPPGSVFKVVTATAGLEERVIESTTEFEDIGEIRIGPYRYGNWYFDQYGRKEGMVNIVKGLKRSNDIFFYRVGELLGAKRLSEWAKAFGFGRKTGIDLSGEADGLVPSPLWKERQKGERWFLGDTYHFAIGQSDLTTTPLQVTRMTGVIASGGKLCMPHVLQAEADCEQLEISESTLRLVSEGMVEACRERGTAFPFFNFKVAGERVEVGCKTGTAEFGDPQDRTHAWFTVYAPAEEPEIVVTVLLEAAGEGSYEAAPVAKEFLEFYFSQK